VAGRPQKNGEEFTVALSISLIEDGESIPFVGRLRDMTERDALHSARDELARAARRLWRLTRSQLYEDVRSSATLQIGRFACPIQPII
jgi:hypothetical protein